MMKKNRKNDNKIQRRINIVVVVSLLIVCSISYSHKQNAMEISGVTECKIIKESPVVGKSISIGRNITLEYYVEGKRYEISEVNLMSYTGIGRHI